LITVLRNGEPDLAHLGIACLTDAAGNCRWSLGDPHSKAFFRSSAKPLQALAMVESGAADAAGLDTADLAIVCGSHRGGPAQAEQVRSLLAKSGLGPEALACGNGLADECSGKHAGMLTACTHLKLPVATYLDAGHPWQRRMLATICEWCAADPREIAMAVDGCSAPTFSLPVYNMALGFARLARAGEKPGAAARLLQAMAENPAGHTGEPDMRPFSREGGCGPFPAAFITKGGANGLHCAAVPGLGLGFALKVVDGSAVPRWPVLTRALELAGLISAGTAAAMRSALWPKIETRRGEPAGEIRPEF
jgi:L-asparaginase II